MRLKGVRAIQGILYGAVLSGAEDISVRSRSLILLISTISKQLQNPFRTVSEHLLTYDGICCHALDICCQTIQLPSLKF